MNVIMNVFSSTINKWISVEVTPEELKEIFVSGKLGNDVITSISVVTFGEESEEQCTLYYNPQTKEWELDV